MQIDDIYGGMLSDNDIRYFWRNGIEITCNEKGVHAFNLDDQLKLGSIDLRFQRQFYRFSDTVSSVTYESTGNLEYLEPVMLKNEEPLILEPGEIVLTSTAEIINFSPSFAGIITGRSSIARLGIMVQCCQEFINPGHGQSIALQIVNLSKNTVVLDRKIPICQLVIFKLRTPASKAYKEDKKSKYSGSGIDSGATKIYTEASGASVQLPQPSKKKKKIGILTRLYNCAEPFLPSIIMLIIITPWISNNVKGKSIGDFLNELLVGAQNAPILPIIGLLCFIILIWNKWRNDKDE